MRARRHSESSMMWHWSRSTWTYSGVLIVSWPNNTKGYDRNKIILFTLQCLNGIVLSKKWTNKNIKLLKGTNGKLISLTCHIGLSPLTVGHPCTANLHWPCLKLAQCWKLTMTGFWKTMPGGPHTITGPNNVWLSISCHSNKIKQ